MRVICIEYLCLMDNIDGGIREYHKDSVYLLRSNAKGNYYYINDFPIKMKTVAKHFQTIFEFRGDRIK